MPYEMLFYYYLLLLLCLPTLIRRLQEFPLPLPVMVYSSLPSLLSHSSSLRVPILTPLRQPQWFSPASPGETPRGGARGICELPRLPLPRPLGSLRIWRWAGNHGAGRESRAPIGQDRSKHPAGWGGAGSGKGRRRLRLFGRFRSWCLQVPWAGLRRAEGHLGC